MSDSVMPADRADDRIVVRYSRTNEVCLIFFGALFGLPTAWFLPSLFHIEPTDFGTSGNGAIAALITRALGPAPFVLLMLLLSFWAVSLGAGSLWRLVERAPALVADRTGIVFHPSVHRRPVAWSDICSVSVAGDPRGLRLVFRRRFWSLGFPFTARTVEIKLIAANLTVGAARDIAKKLNQLRK